MPMQLLREGYRCFRRVLPFRKSMASVFGSFYEHNGWQDPSSRSGPGSNIRQTESIRGQLPSLIQRLDIRSVLDIPCGDFHWMSTVELAVESYVGADIVWDLIKENKTKYASQNVRFECLDITRDNLPQVDLVLCRDLLVHLPFKLIDKALCNLKRSGSRYLLTTTFLQRGTNEEIELGGWRPIDLCAQPFCFPKPIEILVETREGTFDDKALGLWQIEDL